MTDIATIPEETLRKDLEDSCKDIVLCKIALERGIFVYSGRNVQDRLTGNQQVVEKILAELARRDKLAVEAQK